VTVDELIDLLAALASVQSEETPGLSELDHGLQCAQALARAHPLDLQLQVAGLIHDIGHRFGSDVDHGRLGAARVRGLLGERVADLVEAHVPAKRYLVTVDEAYRSHLSAESTRTLAVQGDALSAREAAVFASLPHAAAAIALRRADDAAKIPGREVPALEHWAARLQEAVRLHEAARVQETVWVQQTDR
jgi:predicted HD phosphohydrolase